MKFVSHNLASMKIMKFPSFNLVSSGNHKVPHHTIWWARKSWSSHHTIWWACKSWSSYHTVWWAVEIMKCLIIVCFSLLLFALSLPKYLPQHPVLKLCPSLTLILLTWRIWRAPNNASRWEMGFNLAFKRLSIQVHIHVFSIVQVGT
jgi:hypothetical protein